MLIGMVDTIFADVAQPDQARIVSINAQYFLKNEGHFVISIKVSHQYLFEILIQRILIIFILYFRQIALTVLLNQLLYLHKKSRN